MLLLTAVLGRREDHANRSTKDTSDPDGGGASELGAWKRRRTSSQALALRARRVFPGSVIRFSETPGKVTRCAEFGEHNAYVYQEILGLSKREMEELVKEGVIS